MPAPLIALMGLVSAPAILKNIADAFPPLAIKYQKWAMSKFPVNLPTIAELIEMNYRKVIDDAEYIKRMAENGIDERFSKMFLDSSKQLLNAADYIALYRRGELNETLFKDSMAKVHVDEETTQRLLKATEYYPTPGDLVRFAVREVFTPATAQKFGQYEDFPEEFVREGNKVGLSKENALRYWAAHWDLPSPNMGYEMFQRGIITQDELMMLLKALDIMPFWRDKLIKLSYSPFTRVDVRRMYALGVLTEEQVTRAYQDIGYSPENALLLTKFTVADVLDNEKSATKSQLDKAYKEDLISLAEFRNSLSLMGYTDSTIELYTQMISYDKHIEEINILVAELKARYKAGMMTIKEVENELNGADVPSTYVKNAISKILIAVSEKTKLPTQPDLLKWLNKGIIDEVTFRDKMGKIGYLEEDIDRYFKYGLKAPE